jgi:hypothetical protein
MHVFSYHLSIDCAAREFRYSSCERGEFSPFFVSIVVKLLTPLKSISIWVWVGVAIFIILGLVFFCRWRQRKRGHIPDVTILNATESQGNSTVPRTSESRDSEGHMCSFPHPENSVSHSLTPRSTHHLAKASNRNHVGSGQTHPQRMYLPDVVDESDQVYSGNSTRLEFGSSNQIQI